MPAEDPNFPGRQRRPRKNGTVALYWIALSDAIKAGYPTKTVRLHYPDESDALKQRCQRLQAEMDEWLAGLKDGQSDDPFKVRFDGTLGRMIDIYLSHPDSPYHEKDEVSTQPKYRKMCRRLKRTLGDRRVEYLNGIDFRRWYKEFRRPKTEHEQEHKTGAKDLMTMVTTVLSFGVEVGLPHAKRLIDILREIEFPRGGPREQMITSEQAVSFINKAHELGYHEMALAQAIQYETTLRQTDVIGKWRRSRTKPGELEWYGGVTWDLIDEDGILAHRPGKTLNSSGRQVVHDMNDYPLVTAAAAYFPERPEKGSIIINRKTGEPFTYKEYYTRWRKIARAAGIPNDVWNRDSRAGGVTEARDAGAALDDLARVAGHTQPRQTERYDRGILMRTKRVAKARVEYRNSPGTA